MPQNGLREKVELSQRDGRPLRVKQGFDPSSPDLHIGHAVGLRKLRQFQELGHQVIVIVGDFTAMIGDPSGRNVTRPQLSPEAVEANARTYLEQLSKVLDTSRITVRFNSEWLGGLASADMIRLSSRVTVARLLERDDFHKRFTQNQPIALHELFYPLMQAYDSVMIRADIEIGGTDQRFNNLMGRDLQEAMGQPPQVVLVLPILEGLDGVQKMSKSLNNYIGLTDTPEDMFGKVMSINDTLMLKFWQLATDLPEGLIKTKVEQIQGGTLHPMEAKMELASRIVELYYSKEAAASALESFTKVYRRHEEPDKKQPLPLPKPTPEQPISFIRLLTEHGLAPSASEAKRLIKQGGIRVDGQKVTEPTASIPTNASSFTLQVGKHKFFAVSYSDKPAATAAGIVGEDFYKSWPGKEGENV